MYVPPCTVFIVVVGRECAAALPAATRQADFHCGATSNLLEPAQHLPVMPRSSAEGIMRHRTLVLSVAALVTALPVLAEPAAAQDSGRIFRPFTAPLRWILRAPRPRMGVPRAKRPRAVQQRPSMRKKETVERARPERRQAAAAAAAAGAVGAAALWPSASPSAY